jgi:1,4-dihydroxy-2-naphthoate octaprenyltransferase
VTAAARTWLLAARPRTLPAAAAPVVMGTAIAAGDHALHVPAALTALAGALLIQIGTNYANDYFDGVKGTDTPTRLGPRRATASGLVAPAVMRRAFVIAFALAGVAGAWLVWRAGWPIAVIGVLSVLSGLLYTGGPRPLGYVGLGDLFVLVFFGPVATGGTYYVQALAWSEAALLAGLAPGLLGVALLTVNNLRDVVGDEQAGKRTLAVRFGPRFAKVEYLACLLGAAAVPPVLWRACGAPAGVLAAAAVCTLGLPAARAVVRWAPDHRLAGALAGTGRLLVLYAVAFSIGWLA